MVVSRVVGVRNVWQSLLTAHSVSLSAHAWPAQSPSSLPGCRRLAARSIPSITRLSTVPILPTCLLSPATWDPQFSSFPWLHHLKSVWNHEAHKVLCLAPPAPPPLLGSVHFPQPVFFVLLGWRLSVHWLFALFFPSRCWTHLLSFRFSSRTL